MANPIRYIVAKNGDKLVQAKDAMIGDKYTCRGCGGDMVLHKNEKRPHFQHKAHVSNCTAESVLHLTFKELLY